VEQIAADHARQWVQEPRAVDGAMFNIHAYICGLNEMVSANRDSLKSMGWERKQIVFERYD